MANSTSIPARRQQPGWVTTPGMQTRTLPGHTVDLLRDGASRGMRSEAVMSVAVSMVNHGWTWPDFHAELTNEANQLADWSLRRSTGAPRTSHDTHTRLTRTWRKAERFVNNTPAVHDGGDVVRMVEDLREQANHRVWPGRGGLRDRQVYCALLQLATTRTTLSPTVSVRSLTEMTSYRGWKTICRAVESLVRQGLVQRSSGGNDQPSRFQLMPVPGTAPNRHTSSHAEPGGTGVSLGRSTSSAVRPGMSAETASGNNGAGSSTGGGYRVWPAPDLTVGEIRLGMVTGPHAAAVHASLVEFPMPVNALVGRSGVSRRTVQRWLPRLARLGLARETPLGWVVGDTDPERVAFEHGVEVTEFERHERHELSRQGYHQARRDGREQWVHQRDQAVARSRAARRAYRDRR